MGPEIGGEAVGLISYLAAPFLTSNVKRESLVQQQIQIFFVERCARSHIHEFNKPVLGHLVYQMSACLFVLPPTTNTQKHLHGLLLCRLCRCTGADKKHRYPVVHQGEATLGELCPWPYTGISNQERFYHRGQKWQRLSSRGLRTRRPAEPRGLEPLACIPASHLILSGSRASLESGKPQTEQPPPSLKQRCTPLTLLCNDISV